MRGTSAQVELRFTDIPPPEPEPKRSLYTDLVNLPDPVKLGLTVRIFNYDAVTLYMKVDGYDAAWTFTTNNLGSLASGANMYANLDQFGSRAKPSSETTENITVRLRAYTDSGYTNLKWTYERVLTLVFINSAGGSWTQDVLNNFDDGTVQGWAVAAEEGQASGYPQIGVVTDFVLSTPYACRMVSKRTTSYGQYRARLYKSFTTPNKTTVYAVIDARFDSDMYQALPHTQRFNKYMEIREDGTVYIHVGRLADAVTSPYFPEERWMRLIVPLPPNSTVEIRIAYHCYDSAPGGSGTASLHIDDFKIISK